MAFVLQPARKSYFFGKGYRDLRKTVSESWEANVDSAQKLFARARPYFDDNAANWFLGIFFGAAGISVFIAGAVTFLLTSAVHILILGVFFGVVYAIFTCVYVIERLVMVAYRIFVTCPHCHEKFDLPTYRCPTCNEAHTRLIPGPYGAFYRRCECGARLSTNFISGRTKYQAFCPRCHHAIEQAETTPVCIPVIGPPNSGKTCFLYSFSELLMSSVGPAEGWEVEETDDRTKVERGRITSLVDQGLYPRQTTEKHAQAYKFTIKTGAAVPNVLHLYDAAGEAFLSSEALESHRFYGYCHGFVAIIDAQVMLEIKNGRWNVKSDPEDAFVRGLQAFEKAHGLRSDQVIDLPLAVVLNKIDDVTVSTCFGGVQKPEEISSSECREFLVQASATQLVTVIGQRYRNVRYFAASTLCKEGERLSSRGIEPICRWVLSRAHRSLKSAGRSEERHEENSSPGQPQNDAPPYRV